ncbi:MAG: hypothetical protein WAL50_03060 [Kineosporiaceae bacterium]|jgi:hypothetical protein
MTRHVVFGTGQVGRLVAEPRQIIDRVYRLAGRTAFGELATPLDDALATTLAWHRNAHQHIDRKDTP